MYTKESISTSTQFLARFDHHGDIFALETATGATHMPLQAPQNIELHVAMHTASELKAVHMKAAADTSCRSPKHVPDGPRDSPAASTSRWALKRGSAADRDNLNASLKRAYPKGA